ncbi:MAG TPA: hypothetical protein PKW33_21045, partial [Anaerolineaceae bacterium]|nr:hypothetical protein [Anaerolineaceae bacterium]HPN54097.1 hypothetical protein [Anaerolineaceae bacterium]
MKNTHWFHRIDCAGGIPGRWLFAKRAGHLRVSIASKQCREKDMGPRSIRQVFVSHYRSQVEAAQIYN